MEEQRGDVEIYRVFISLAEHDGQNKTKTQERAIQYRPARARHSLLLAAIATLAIDAIAVTRFATVATLANICTTASRRFAAIATLAIYAIAVTRFATVAALASIATATIGFGFHFLATVLASGSVFAAVNSKGKGKRQECQNGYSDNGFMNFRHDKSPFG